MANFFPENLKKIREHKGLSQNKLGELFGVNQTTIARWENIYRHKKNKNYVIMISKPVKTSISRIDGKKNF